MVNRTLTLKIHGTPGEIDYKALQKALEALGRLLQSVGGHGTELFIDKLNTSSIIVDVHADPALINNIDNGLQQIATKSQRPPHWNNDALDAVEMLYMASQKRGVTGLSLGFGEHIHPIDRTLCEHIHTARVNFRQALGSATGELYSISNRDGQTKARMIDHKTGRRINLILTEELLHSALSFMNKKVRVRGLITKDPTNNHIIEVQVENLKEITPKSLRTSAKELQGILGEDWLGGLSPVEIVRQERRA